jgi:hypothetical protein
MAGIGDKPLTTAQVARDAQEHRLLGQVARQTGRVRAGATVMWGGTRRDDFNDRCLRLLASKEDMGHAEEAGADFNGEGAAFAQSVTEFGRAREGIAVFAGAAELLISTLECEPCYHERDEYSNDEAGSGHLATPAGLGAASSRLVEQRYRGRAGGQPCGGEPMAQARLGRRCGHLADAASPWPDTPAERRAAGPNSWLVSAGSPGLWLSRRRVDRRPDRGSVLAHLPRALSSRPRQSPAPADRLELPAAPRAREPAQRAGDSGMVRGTLARHQKN